MDMAGMIEAYNSEKELPFSGAVYVREEDGGIFEQAYGYANRSEQTKNQTNTRFGVASGCKIFTAVAIGQLVEKGLLLFDTRLNECLPIRFPFFDPDITVHQLLTHSSGIPDYFDEETMSDYAELWRSVPMYAMTSPSCFLPLFQNERMKFAPGSRFSYSNAGFIVLGLIVEQLAGIGFTEYVQTHIFQACGMNDSGYFWLDRLPERTATGYINDGYNWKTNIFSLPVVGGPDGGAYTTVQDLATFWEALLGNRLLSASITHTMLLPHRRVSEELSYGYGVWISTPGDGIFKYYVMGGDPGVNMQSSVYAESGIQAHVITNTSTGAGSLAARIDKAIWQRMQSSGT
ncbi:serine hydrolase domain-containing protein [Paenibacillus ginsengarvi]|uniref:Class A beta-lactamase-related serine hydrolase n=1 Tax=Paenibacillus ginsengarvi TaxID=400777 RepID=A0A3B0C7M6_9BACL|nr:serine hydrolase domain-containing protein [Paenibacillus ginsengarvi]RKN80631.1 class A beta-lactamase-related serine hydrolase [Paenibacillus ginsengarvi]